MSRNVPSASDESFFQSDYLYRIFICHHWQLPRAVMILLLKMMTLRLLSKAQHAPLATQSS